ncbi:MAG: hypothetical protein HOO96_12045 [Polyangiaceae bacterium]|nr:hypothetical protein [Polyangiaceae bacterium]
MLLPRWLALVLLTSCVSCSRSAPRSQAAVAAPASSAVPPAASASATGAPRKAGPPTFEGPSNVVQSMALTDAGQVRFVNAASLVEWTPATSAMTKRPIPFDTLYTAASKAPAKVTFGKEGELLLPPMAAPASCIAKADCKRNAEATEAEVSFEFSDDGQRVLFAACEFAVYPALCALSVFDFASGAVVAKLFSGGWTGGVARHLAPKGDYAILVGVGRTEIVSLASQKIVFSAAYTINDFPRFRFVDEHTVLFSAAGELKVVELTTGKLVRRKVLADDTTLELGPDGRRVLLTGTGFAVWSATTGVTVNAVKGPPRCADCKGEWTSDRHVRFSGLGAGRPDVLFDAVTKTQSESAPPDEAVFAADGFTVTRNLWDGSLRVTTPTGKRAPLEATKDAPRFFVAGGRLFAQCWAWADIIEADGTGHSFPRTVFQAH